MNHFLAREAKKYVGQQGQWWVTSERFGRIARFWSSTRPQNDKSVLSWSFDFSDPKFPKTNQSRANSKIAVLKSSLDDKGGAFFAIDVPDENFRVKSKVGLHYGKFEIDENAKTVKATGIRLLKMEDLAAIT